METSIRRAMLLAAGEGTRLLPLTLATPKVMLPIGGKPLLEHTINWLHKHDVTELGINLHYLGQQVVDFIGDGSALGVKAEYSWEQSLLGTAGGTKLLEKLFAGETFLVVYGDMFTNVDLRRMAEYHVRSGSVATIALFEVPDPHQKGIVELDANGRILSFVEKPPNGTEKSNLANGGICILEPEVLARVPPSCPCDFGFDVFPALLRDGRPMYGYRPSPGEYLMDIGSLGQYRQANEGYAAGELR